MYIDKTQETCPVISLQLKYAKCEMTQKTVPLPQFDKSLFKCFLNTCAEKTLGENMVVTFESRLLVYIKLCIYCKDISLVVVI